MIKKYTTKKGEIRYMFQTYLGIDPDTGKQKRTTRRGFKTIKEAKRAEAELQLEVEENGFGSNDYSDCTFQEMTNLWLEFYSPTIRPTTLESVKSYCKAINKELGMIKMSHLTVVRCQKAIQNLYLKYKAASLMYSVMNRICKYALNMDIIDSNPLDRVIKPRCVSDEQSDKIEKFYTKEELLEFLELLKKDERPFDYTFFHLLAYTGLRIGEAIGLRWGDIDFQNEVLSVNRTAVYLTNQQLCQSPKTRKSKRSISLAGDTVDVLKKWRVFQIQEFFKLGKKFLDEEQYIFTSPTGEWHRVRRARERLNYLTKKHNLKSITPHSFRHTHCSLLFEAGATPKEVQERLGHSTMKMTMEVYAHVTQKQKDKTAILFSEFMSEIS